MDFGPEEAFADSAGAEHVIVLRLQIPGHLNDCFLAGGASLNVHVQITARTYRTATFSFTLSDVLAALRNPAGEGFQPPLNIVP
jgi:hypothetical protein